MKLVIPIPEKVSLNKIHAGVHWTKRSKWRNDYHLAVRCSKPKKYTGSFPAIFHYHFKLKGRSLDSTNMAFMCKLVEDGLVESGVIPDDSQKYVYTHFPTYEKIKTGDEEVVVSILDSFPQVCNF